jgi:hypothetical protein
MPEVSLSSTCRRLMAARPTAVRRSCGGQAVAVVLAGLGLLLVPGARASAQARPFGYTAGTQRYRVTTTTHNQRDQTGGRAPMEYDVTTTEVVTVTLAPRGRDTLTLSVHIDSIDGSSTNMNAPMPALDWARGATLSGTISPTGQIYAFAAADSETNLAALYASFRHFLTQFPMKTVGVGTTWSDTSRERVLHRSSFDSVKTETVATWKVSGDTTVAGQPAWKVERSSVIAMTGEGAEGGLALHLDGDGTIRSVNYVSPRGIYLGARSTQTMRIVESFKESGSGAPQTQTIKSTIEPLPPIRTASAR